MDVNTKDLIHSLTSDLEEVKCMAHPFKRTMMWLVFASAYMAFISFSIGIRWDFSEKLYDISFALEIFVVGAMSISAALCSLWLCVPDMRGQKLLLAVPSGLFAVFMVWLFTKVILSVDHMPILEWHHCAQNAFVLGVLPVVSLLLLMGKGRTTHPKFMSFMNSLAVSGLGYIALRITCSAEDMGHIFVFHFMPYLLISFLIALLGRRIYRW